MRRHRVVLYNSQAPCFTMPLGLIAVGSAPDRTRYDVVIIDGRIESGPVGRRLGATDGALCRGLCVLTGTPIADALSVTQAVRARRPDCRIVWGGRHPSLFPVETLDEAGVDAVVVGLSPAAYRSISSENVRSPFVERFRFYRRIGRSRPSVWRMPIQALARWRCRRDASRFPVEKAIAEWMRPSLAS